MYENYTDKQIVEMLIPKLNKAVPELDWNEYLKRPDDYTIWTRLLSVIYKSGYIRGQLGRSFIVGEKAKSNERWVSANKDSLKYGVKVRFINAEKHRENPNYYPAKEVIGQVKKVYDCYQCLVQWPEGSTSRNDEWYAANHNREVLVCE